jgi:hypothetical protein
MVALSCESVFDSTFFLTLQVDRLSTIQAVISHFLFSVVY